MQDILLPGFSIGFVAASPVGPIGLLCLCRTLARGIAAVLISAPGVAFAYGFWSFAAVRGVVAVSHWFVGERAPLQLVIGLFFLLYGVHGTLNKPAADDCPELRRRRGIGEFMSTFPFVLQNPATFIMFSALFAPFGIVNDHYGLLESLEIALTTFAGAAGFWLVVAQVVERARADSHDASSGFLVRLSLHAIALIGTAICVYRLCASFRPRP